ncbi:hypothetical protein JZX87_04720 [Agrobacterium sp. Ap1]|uniref:hypothetical protein n=1 Tax=Agrobacterium sp. Ap1 TaxID=2815337 RepID=UPI001A8E5BD7|nr:hypothetical protein [Agrobacterium sp. Ap1]MBO0140471.1 hypothetical protein [Agrobacterium sp. Ap1]
MAGVISGGGVHRRNSGILKTFYDKLAKESLSPLPSCILSFLFPLMRVCFMMEQPAD